MTFTPLCPIASQFLFINKTCKINQLWLIILKHTYFGIYVWNMFLLLTKFSCPFRPSMFTWNVPILHLLVTIERKRECLLLSFTELNSAENNFRYLSSKTMPNMFIGYTSWQNMPYLNFDPVPIQTLIYPKLLVLGSWNFVHMILQIFDICY